MGILANMSEDPDGSKIIPSPIEDRKTTVCSTDIIYPVEKIDSRALNGLRGFASIHVMAFHLLQPRGWMGADSLCGSVEMPVSFLLSGFCLALGNGKTKWDGCTTLCTDKVGNYFDYRRFFLNRIARIGPLYY